MDITLRQRAIRRSASEPTSKTTTGTTPKTSKLRAYIETALIFIGLLAYGLLLPHELFSDGQKRFNELNQLLSGHGFSTDKYSMIGPIFSAPLWYLGALYRGAHWWVPHYNVIVFALGLGAIWLMLKDRVDRGLLRRFFLLLIAASMFADHIQAYYGEVFTTIVAGVGLLAMVVGPAVGGWIAVALGVANTPATLVALAGAMATHIWRQRKLRYVLVVVAALAMIGLENWIRRGSPLNSRYEPGFTFPIFLGLLSILFSLGKGLVFYAPGILLPFKALKRRILELGAEIGPKLWSVYLLWLAFTAGLVLIYSHWYDWSGDWFWGPRFLLFASLPASFALAVFLDRREQSLLTNVAIFGVLLLSFWVGLNGAIIGQDQLLVPCLAKTSPYVGNICFYAPQSSALWRPIITGFTEIHWGVKEWLYALYTGAVFLYFAYPLLRDIFFQLIPLVLDRIINYWATLRGRAA